MMSRQGHGVQRAVMIAMLQALVPDERTAQQDASHEGPEVAADEQAMTQAELAALPGLIVCIEEPEIYQYPVRARSFARVLASLAKRLNTQVLIATHSPYFVTPEQFASLRCFALGNGCTQISSTSLGDVANTSTAPASRVTRAVEKELPRTFSEGFFADAVVFVEGDTDRVVIEVIAHRLATALDSAGIAMLSMGGKENLYIPFVILQKLKIPAYVVADCDVLGAARKHTGDEAKVRSADESHKKSTESLLSWLPVSTMAGMGTLPFTYGDPSVVAQHFTLFNDDLEGELSNWPSFLTSLRTYRRELRDKDVAAYRMAAMDAELEDMPEIFNHLVEAVLKFKSVSDESMRLAESGKDGS
ncbi:MAG TPA: TOPRIM nucleotidyl transferase/hydrolase domain-containing protein [Solirubrobacteraceae bacterium]